MRAAPAVEALEHRRLLSVAVAAIATRTLRSTADPLYLHNRTITRRTSDGTVVPSYAGSASPSGLTPTVVRSAYNMGQVTFYNHTTSPVVGDGTGQTIAIIDAYDDPNAFGDLNAFSTQFGLPTLINNSNPATLANGNGPTFTKVSQTGSTTSLPGTDPAGAYWSTKANTWEQEESLDIEWAHVMAPEANIVLVECNSPSTANLVGAGVQYARNLSGVDVVSMSFNGDEFSGETSYDGYFTTPANHVGGSATLGGTRLNGGVTFLASAGDNGVYGSDHRPTGGTDERTTVKPQYPAASPNVVAVGGTTLNTNSTGYVSETAWGSGTSSGTSGGGGGGISAYEGQPVYQTNSGLVSGYSTTKRVYPDVAADADPNTGVPIYDSWDFDNPNDTTYTPWIPGYEGGTSLACPLVAGMVAVADQGRALNSGGSYDGFSQALPDLYSIEPTTDFHDITSGSNGPSPTYAAATGFDLTTGRGSPKNPTFTGTFASVALTGSATGRTFRDNNADGLFNNNDTVLAGVTVYYDVNNNGVYDTGELTATSNSSGIYTLNGLNASTAGHVRLYGTLSGYQISYSPVAYVLPGVTQTLTDVGLFPNVFNSTIAADAWRVRVNPANSTQTQILDNGTVVASAPTSLISGLTFNLFGGGDSLTVDETYGGALPKQSITYNGAAGANDALNVIATSGTDFIFAQTTEVSTSGDLLFLKNIASTTIDPRGGEDDLQVLSGTVHIPAQTAGGGILTRTFLGLTVDAGAKLIADSAASAADRTVYVVDTNTFLNPPRNELDISDTGQLDLGSNDMVLRGADLPTVTGYAATGYAAGAWNGYGLASATAATDASRRQALGVLLNGSQYNTFDGVAVSPTDVLVKHTLYGDANLDGSVTIADFNALAADFGRASQTWAGGDFNYDGSVTIADFNLLAADFGTSLTAVG